MAQTINNLTETWNSAGVVFTGIKYNVTDTASAANSLLMDLQVGGASRFSVNKAGTATATALNTATLVTTGACNFQSLVLTVRDNVVRTWNGGSYNWASTSGSDGPTDLSLFRDVADTLAQRRGVNAQTFRLYNTYTDVSNYERAKIQWDTNVLKIGTERAGTGAARALELQTDGTTRLVIEATNTITAGVDGAAFGSPARRWVFYGYTANLTNVQFAANGWFSASSDGVFKVANNANAGFDRLQLGGTTSSFPALKRSTTTLQARLADDSVFTNIQGKLTTDTAYTAGAPTADGYLVIYDSNGTAYKIPAVAV